MPDADAQAAVAHVALRIGRRSLTDGADATHVRRAVENAIGAFGYEAHALVEPEAVLVTILGEGGSVPRSAVPCPPCRSTWDGWSCFAT